MTNAPIVAAAVKPGGRTVLNATGCHEGERFPRGFALQLCGWQFFYGQKWLEAAFSFSASSLTGSLGLSTGCLQFKPKPCVR